MLLLCADSFLQICRRELSIISCYFGEKIKAPPLDRKGARTNHRQWCEIREIPFSKEGGAVSGGTRRSQTMRIYPF